MPTLEQEYWMAVCEHDAQWQAYCRCPTDATWAQYVAAGETERAAERKMHRANGGPVAEYNRG